MQGHVHTGVHGGAPSWPQCSGKQASDNKKETHKVTAVSKHAQRQFAGSNHQADPPDVRQSCTNTNVPAVPSTCTWQRLKSGLTSNQHFQAGNQHFLAGRRTNSSTHSHTSNSGHHPPNQPTGSCNLLWPQWTVMHVVLPTQGGLLLLTKQVTHRGCAKQAGRLKYITT